MNIYLTADRIGTKTGGGIVTLNEYQALEQFGGKALPLDNAIVPVTDDPFENDRQFLKTLKEGLREAPQLAHIYAGCFSETVKYLKSLGTKVTYTAAAHDPKLSREEHEALGISFNYPHLTDPVLWQKYLEGYLGADLVICPSHLSVDLMRSFGCERISLVPHGVDLPKEIPPFPKQFRVGYFGAIGADKGVRYLLEAWKELAYPDATLVLGGRASMGALPLVRRFGGGNIRILGEVNDLSEFYREISVYVQPSVTEGFGIEVLEAMAHGRPAIVSDGAGASDIVTARDGGGLARIRNVDDIVHMINFYRVHANGASKKAAEVAMKYEWGKIRNRYVEAWGNVLNPVRA